MHCLGQEKLRATVPGIRGLLGYALGQCPCCSKPCVVQLMPDDTNVIWHSTCLQWYEVGIQNAHHEPRLRQEPHAEAEGKAPCRSSQAEGSATPAAELGNRKVPQRCSVCRCCFGWLPRDEPMAAGNSPLSRGARHELARWAAALCYIYENGNSRAAVDRFKRHHPLLVEFAAKRLDKFVRHWGEAGFDDKGQLQKAPPHGRPPILSEKDAEKAAVAVAAGTMWHGVVRRFRTLGEAFSKSPALQRLLRSQKGNLNKPVSRSTVAASIHRARVQIHKVQPERVPLLTARQKAERVEVAKILLSKPESFIKKLAYWDHTGFRMAEAVLRDAVWTAKSLGRPVEQSKHHEKRAKFQATGCLCGVSFKKGTIGPFENAPPGKYKVRFLPTFRNQV